MGIANLQCVEVIRKHVIVIEAFRAERSVAWRLNQFVQFVVQEKPGVLLLDITLSITFALEYEASEESKYTMVGNLSQVCRT